MSGRMWQPIAAMGPVPGSNAAEGVHVPEAWVEDTRKGRVMRGRVTVKSLSGRDRVRLKSIKSRDERHKTFRLQNKCVGLSVSFEGYVVRATQTFSAIPQTNSS
jgi:hypothetical protein